MIWFAIKLVAVNVAVKTKNEPTEVDPFVSKFC